jgi:hypothetical protein
MGTEKKKKKAGTVPPPPCAEPAPETAPEPKKGAARRSVQPVDEKIGEPPDNLKRRGEWFRKRTGGKS